MHTLHRRGHPLALLPQQHDLLSGAPVPAFERMLAQHGLLPLRRGPRIRVLQLNLGKLCNQTCRHCHVDAGPDRSEVMSRQTMALALTALDQLQAELVDLTGGAPEMNPHFRWLVEQVRRRGTRVIDRCNLTILTLPAYADLVAFLAGQQVEIVASLPYYIAQRTDAQRGAGVFERSIAALRRLNDAGYGLPDGRLPLTLVYNPIGAFLPPRQDEIEAEYRRELRRHFGIEFTRLYTITNMPINRFLEYLVESGNYVEYMERLHRAFSPLAAGAAMCRDTLSVGWDGVLYDCDFNQMLELPVDHGAPRHLQDLVRGVFEEAAIVTGQHCYGCAAGAGSSCSGALLEG